MTVFHAFPAPAKLNLFLHVTGRRNDGYHLLQTAFRLIDHGDTVHIAIDGSGNVVHENPLPGVPADTDLIVRAARLLQQATGTRQGCRLRIDKRLPMGGGLGGGSSDAATTLIALNHLWRLGLNRGRLQELGLQLGADVPFFVYGRDAFAEGVGEALQPISLPAQWYAVLIPPVSVPTVEIFSDPALTRNSEPIIMAAFPSYQIRNDLEAVAKRKYPIIAEYLAWLSQYGKAMMTGSGACVFAAFDTQIDAERVIKAMPAEMQGFIAPSLMQHPLLDLLD
ncbi:4-(cytidine 5'-diphospho)-2-C-methyl-D-erythritol kinase [Chitinimonas arctica]|uniref:4-diphosphocytidyl-2-C-methyl-D-erythritol kinase n=1 Tax=Chitinimonas arctica TaxID=2594795 RepID=A0A516SEJ2_9NEIS|nr:4-(cytidine 5'-diphospho)-2-C-methyl-D-erythritol kinase [Chitinimonas arctica]QDQ26438.1 4-(cytidine 5'-diphospho)-2-C-methyl-D-erythritol kinase [Chitinimonas arctica]